MVSEGSVQMPDPKNDQRSSKDRRTDDRRTEDGEDRSDEDERREGDRRAGNERRSAAQQEKTWERLPCMGWAVGWHPWS
jgi:hypothetical protein